MNKVRRLTTDAVLAAAALLLFIVEAQIPPLTAIPGIKIGLANTVTLIAVYLCGKKDAAAVLFVRIILGTIFAGNFSTFLYSASGGILCCIITCVLSGILSKQIWVVSIFGAIAHNIGQLLAASVLLQTVSVFWYLPYLLLAAILSGAFTGICAAFLIHRLQKIQGSENRS